MHMRPVHETVALLEEGGFDVLDVEDLREHYAATAWAWHDNFTRNYDEIVDLVGEEVARVWQLYIVGGALAFEEGRMGVEQILATTSVRARTVSVSDFSSGAFVDGLAVTAVAVAAPDARDLVDRSRDRAVQRDRCRVGARVRRGRVGRVRRVRRRGQRHPPAAGRGARVGVGAAARGLHRAPQPRARAKTRATPTCSHAPRAIPGVYALRSIYLTQAVALWFISLPVQVSMFERSEPGVLLWVGTAVWAVGLFFETVGDAQLNRFRADPSTKGQVMDRGLWRYTRHPNYFGDATVWWGLWLIAAQQWAGVLTILSPLLMTWTLTRKTGKPLLEQGMADRRPGYADYVARTSGFFPLPPKRTVGSVRPPLGSLQRMRFGFKTAPQHTTWGTMLEVWQAADDIDFYESGWTFDHFYPIFSDSTGNCLEGWTVTTALAAVTRRLRVGVLVTGMPYRHPAVLANMAATLDVVSDGRLELGLGAGWNEEEAGAYGIDIHSDAHRPLRRIRRRPRSHRRAAHQRAHHGAGALRAAHRRDVQPEAGPAAASADRDRRLG